MPRINLLKILSVVFSEYYSLYEWSREWCLKWQKIMTACSAWERQDHLYPYRYDDGHLQALYHPQKNIPDSHITMSQYMKSIPTKWGFKMFALNYSSNGNTEDFTVCMAKGKFSLPQAQDSHLSLIKPAFLGSRYRLFVDHFYTSLKPFLNITYCTERQQKGNVTRLQCFEEKMIPEALSCADCLTFLTLGCTRVRKLNALPYISHTVQRGVKAVGVSKHSPEADFFLA